MILRVLSSNLQSPCKMFFVTTYKPSTVEGGSGKSLGLAGYQPSSRFSERIRQGVMALYALLHALLPLCVQVCIHTHVYTYITYTHTSDIYISYTHTGNSDT